jgi:hypothetical protein
MIMYEVAMNSYDHFGSYSTVAFLESTESTTIISIHKGQFLRWQSGGSQDPRPSP